jgi:hypothetical protein
LAGRTPKAEKRDDAVPQHALFFLLNMSITEGLLPIFVVFLPPLYLIMAMMSLSFFKAMLM